MTKPKSNGTVTIEGLKDDQVLLQVEEAITSILSEEKEVTIARLKDGSYFIGVKGFTEGSAILHIPEEAFASLLSTMVLFAKADNSSEKLFEIHLENFKNYDLTENLKSVLDNIESPN